MAPEPRSGGGLRGPGGVKNGNKFFPKFSIFPGITSIFKVLIDRNNQRKPLYTIFMSFFESLKFSIMEEKASFSSLNRYLQGRNSRKKLK